MKVNQDFVDSIEKEILDIEKKLESVGSKICGVEGGSESWNYINRALDNLRESMQLTWQMRPIN